MRATTRHWGEWSHTCSGSYKGFHRRAWFSPKCIPHTHMTVTHTYSFLVANGFHKHGFTIHPGFLESFNDHASSCLCGIGGIKSRHPGFSTPSPTARWGSRNGRGLGRTITTIAAVAVVGPHVANQIVQGGIAGFVAGGRPRRIVGTVKFGRLLGAKQAPTIIADIKDLTGNVMEETQKTTNAFGNVRLARGG